MHNQCERGEPAGGGGLALTGEFGGGLSHRPYCTHNPQNAQIPSHLVGEEVRLWLEAERAKGRGDRQAAWAWRRRLLLHQAGRYDGGAP